MDITRILNVTGLVGKSSPAGWWYTYPSEKYEFVRLDQLFSLENQIHVPNHQPDNY